MAEWAKKTRNYRVIVAVDVDDVNKPEYEAAMELLCTRVFTELKAIVRSISQGSNRITLEIEKIS